MKKWAWILLVVLVFATTTARADIVIKTKDGRSFTVPVQASEVASIEFVATAPPPAPPQPPAQLTPPAGPAGGSFLSTLTSGRAISGEAWGTGGGHWKFEIKISSYNKASGAIVGEIHWPSLGSVHRIRGTLTESKLTFTETEAIQAGGAHLNCSYTLTVSASSATGTWIDNGDKTTGGIKIPVP